MTERDPFIDIEPGAGLNDLIKQVERAQREMDRATGITPEMMRAASEPFRFGGGRRQGKTNEFFVGMDRASAQGDRTGFAVRDRDGATLIVTFEPHERITPELVRKRVRELIAKKEHDFNELLTLTARQSAEAEARSEGHRVVEGTVLGRSIEREDHAAAPR